MKNEDNFSCGPIAAVCGELVQFFVESEPTAVTENQKPKEEEGWHLGTTEKPHKVLQADPLCLQREGTCRESSTVRTIPRYTGSILRRQTSNPHQRRLRGND